MMLVLFFSKNLFWLLISLLLSFHVFYFIYTRILDPKALRRWFILFLSFFAQAVKLEALSEMRKGQIGHNGAKLEVHFYF